MVAAPPLAPRRRIPATARAADAAPVPVAVPWLPPPATATAAERAALLQQRRQAADQCRACPIGQHATQTVHGEGPLDARWMVVGEQPGDAEDLTGRPLVGPSGQLFNRALAALGWPREALYLSNAVRHFKYLPRGKRRLHKTPAQQEAAACLHWLEEEIALVRPAVLVALGATAARALLGADVPVLRARGRWFGHAGSGTPVLVTLHPSALLRLPPAEQAQAFAAWCDDLRQARDGPPHTG
jgi:DNA polymerase